jgi:Putative DNA-binding domain
VSSLIEFQRQMAATLLQGAAAEGMEVHCATVLNALVNALRLTFPTIVELTGREFFDQVATEYARQNPPDCAVLYSYGDGFPQHLRLNDGARSLPYLWDAARYDLSIDRAAHQAPDWRTTAIAIDAELDIYLVSSLTCLRVDHPVNLIRDSIEAGHPEELSELDMRPQARYFAIWRGTHGAAVKQLNAASAGFLASILKGFDAGTAIQHAASHGRRYEALMAIHAYVVSAPFARMHWRQQPSPPPG